MVPAYNEEKNISLCLKSLLRQTLRPVQIIVCDNESTDNTRQIADQILNKSNISFRIISERKKPSIEKGNINFVYWRGEQISSKRP